MLEANHRESAPAAHNRRAGGHGSRIGARLRLDHRHDLARSAHPTSCRGRGIVETNQLDGLLDNLDEVSYRQALGSRYRRWLSAVVNVNLRGMGEQRHFVRRAESLQR